MIKRQNYSFHNHTYLCGHANGLLEQYIVSALDSGITTLGISDHIPYKGIDFVKDRMLYTQLPLYYQMMEEMKEKYKGKINLYTGFEVEFDEMRIDEIKARYAEVDYLLIGQHNKSIGNGEFDDYVDFTHYVSDDEVMVYADLVCRAMETGLFAAVNHPDYFMLGRRSFNSYCIEASKQICMCAAKLDIPLEINLKGLRRKKQTYVEGDFYAYPLRSFWEIAATYNVKVLYGHDAHNPLDFFDDREIALANEILHGLSFEQVELKMHERTANKNK